MSRTRIALITLALLLFSFACSKKKEEAPAPAPEPAPVVEPVAEEVTEPPKPVVEVEEEPETTDPLEEVSAQLADVYFDFDKSQLRPDTRAALERYATVLKANPDFNVLVEGHCDERGTEEYNQALGERRASSVKSYLVSLGVEGGRLRTVSYGELRPKAQGSDEEAWSQNRRAHFVLSRAK